MDPNFLEVGTVIPAPPPLKFLGVVGGGGGFFFKKKAKKKKIIPNKI